MAFWGWNDALSPAENCFGLGTGLWSLAFESWLDFGGGSQTKQKLESEALVVMFAGGYSLVAELWRLAFLNVLFVLRRGLV